MAGEGEIQDPQHLLDLIRAVRPRAALFTTYTFSVGYFDAVFVPVLRSVGCQDIAVLVDADQAARGIEESRSRAAGRIYRVAPVIAPGGGVFHPKLAYFAAEADDFLAVSSGNLTASGQSLQLESFDVVSASSAPTVFLQLGNWLESLAAQVETTSPQASALLKATAPRARQAYTRNQANLPGTPPAPTLITTLEGTARDALQSVFFAEADSAESVIVLAPFHSPDGGPVVRLASDVGASSLAVGLDGSRPRLLAPFERDRFNPGMPSRFVVPDAKRATRRLHAKVFELHTPDNVLVMTGSVNATAQSFESTMNVEVSLARWLPKSPFEWLDAEAEDYQPTQVGTDFLPPLALYVDAWLEEDRTLRGRLTSRDAIDPSLAVTITRGEHVLFTAQTSVDDEAGFKVGNVPSFDVSEAALLTVTSGEFSASCWLNVDEQLDIAMEERERRAAVGRVLRGEYAVEDIAEVVRLLTSAAEGIASGSTAELRRPAGEAKAETEVPFSFLRWERSGQQRGGNTFLGRTPNELLKALTRWMNADLAPRAAEELAMGVTPGLGRQVQLLGGTDEEQESATGRVDPYELLDKLCVAIPIALERRPGLEYGGVLAEVAASRAVDRALKQDLKLTPCIAWLDRFSRLSFPESAHTAVREVATAMACVAAAQLELQGQDPQLAVLREAVERFAGEPMNAEHWRQQCEAGLARDLFRRVIGAERDASVSITEKLASVQTLDDGLLVFLGKAWTVARNFIAREPEALTFPELATSLRERRPRKKDLIRGLVGQAQLASKSPGCPFCGNELSKEQLTVLKQRHVLVHKGLSCNNVLMMGERGGRLHQGLEELPDA